jgi:hypothetical protein
VGWFYLLGSWRASAPSFSFQLHNFFDNDCSVPHKMRMFFPLLSGFIQLFWSFSFSFSFLFLPAWVGLLQKAQSLSFLSFFSSFPFTFPFPGH